MNERRTVRIFRFLAELDAFVVTEEYREIADYLHLAEWTPVVWIGRLFRLDNDVGEHWFDNWDLREERAAKAEALGLHEEELHIIDPDRFQDGRDGPCHDALQRKRFWTDVLRSLELSYETLFDEARKVNARIKNLLPEEYLPDLENRIERIGSGRFQAFGTHLMKSATRVTGKGQVVIPKPVREQLRWASGTQLAVEIMGDRAVRLAPLEAEDPIDTLYGCLKDLPRDPLADLEAEHQAEIEADKRWRR